MRAKLRAFGGAASEGPIIFQANMGSLTPIRVPIDALEHLVFEKISMTGRGLPARSSTPKRD